MLVDGLRPLWLQSIAEVDGSPAGRLSDWVGDGQYYFDGPVGPSAASFVLAPGSNLLHTFAAEMSRFSSAAIETSIGIAQPGLPKRRARLTRSGRLLWASRRQKSALARVPVSAQLRLQH